MKGSTLNAHNFGYLASRLSYLNKKEDKTQMEEYEFTILDNFETFLDGVQSFESKNRSFNHPYDLGDTLPRFKQSAKGIEIEFRAIRLYLKEQAKLNKNR